MSSLSFRNRLFPFLIFLALFALATYGSGLFVDVTRDGSKYATIAREIYETGDYVNLKIHSEPYIEKPPMLFWAGALSFKIFGLSNFSFKFPVLLISFFGLFSAYRLGKSIYNPRIGLIAALLLGSSQIYFLYNMDIHTDTVLQAFATFSLWQLYEFLKSNRSVHIFLGFCGIGLSMLTKGPIGAIVPVFAVLAYLITMKQLRRLMDFRWYLGVFLSFLIILPALKGLFNQFGWKGIQFFFWTNNAGRLSGSYVSNNSDFLFFLHNLLYLFLPWMLLLYASVWIHFGNLVKRRLKARDWFIAGGLWPLFILISVSRAKLPNYVFILIPLFSVLTARYIFIALSGFRRKLSRIFFWLQAVSFTLVIILIIILVFWLFPIHHTLQWIILGISLVVAFYFISSGGTLLRKLILSSLTAVICLNFFINQHIAPQIFSDQASVKAAEIFNRRASSGDNLFSYNYSSFELFFYAKKTVRSVPNDVTVIELMKKPGNWVFTTGEVVARLPGSEFPGPEIIPLSHVWINKLNFRYLNPRTRGESHDTLYLLRSTASGNSN